MAEDGECPTEIHKIGRENDLLEWTQEKSIASVETISDWILWTLLGRTILNLYNIATMRSRSRGLENTQHTTLRRACSFEPVWILLLAWGLGCYLHWFKILTDILGGCGGLIKTWAALSWPDWNNTDTKSSSADGYDHQQAAQHLPSFALQWPWVICLHFL